MEKIAYLRNYVKRQDFEEVLDALCDVTLELAKRVEIKSEELISQADPSTQTHPYHSD